MSDDVLKDWQSTAHILFDDVLLAAAEVERVGDGFVRRSYVRTVFVAIEGSTHGMKRVVLHVWNQRQSKLDVDDLECLTETKFDEQGSSRKRFLCFRDNVKFVFKAFAKIHGFACAADFNCKGWSALLDAAEIRDRLMHPKSSQDLNVSDEDMAKIREAADWYFPTRDQLVAQATREIKGKRLI
jgi:hypothetical protein